MSSEQNNTFGDSALAARRLQWLAEVFAPGSERFQAHYGQNMLIGERLAALCEQAGYLLIDAGVRLRDFSAAQMARLHAANLPTWSQDPFARATFDPERLQALGDTLSEIAAGQDEAPPVNVGTGHVVAMLRE